MIDYASTRGKSRREEDENIERLDLPLIDCGLGESPFGLPNSIKEFLRNPNTNEALRDSVEHYQADRYFERAARLIRERFDLPDGSDAPRIFLSEGGSYALLDKIILVLPDLTTEHEIGVMGVGPQFPNIAGLVKQHGVMPDGKLRFPYMSIKPSLELPLSEKIRMLIEMRKRENGYRFIYVDNPNNPTGDFAPIEAIEELVQFTMEKGDVLIIDEAYGDVLPDDQSAIRLTTSYPRLIVIRGMVKVIGAPGLRIGYGVFSKDIGDIFENVPLVFGISGPQQLIGYPILQPEILREHFSTIIPRIETIKKVLREGLESLGLWIAPTHPSVPIMLVKGPSGFFRMLARYQIVTEKGSDFQETYPLDDSFVRMRIPEVWRMFMKL